MPRGCFGRVIDSVSVSLWTARSMARTTCDEKSRVGMSLYAALWPRGSFSHVIDSISESSWTALSALSMARTHSMSRVSHASDPVAAGPGPGLSPDVSILRVTGMQKNTVVKDAGMPFINKSRITHGPKLHERVACHWNIQLTALKCYHWLRINPPPRR
jgi:hypothetical protein